MELDDCAYPLLNNVVLSKNTQLGFTNADYAFLIGSRSRGPGMERRDLLKYNGEIFMIAG